MQLFPKPLPGSYKSGYLWLERCSGQVWTLALWAMRKASFSPGSLLLVGGELGRRASI